MTDGIHPENSNLDSLLAGDLALIDGIRRLIGDEARPKKVRSAFTSVIEQSEDKDREISF